MAKIIPNTLTHVTGFPNTSKDMAITNIRLDADATAYVNGVTKDNILNAIIFCSQFNTPSVNNKTMTR